MNTKAHLASLERKHNELEKEISKEMSTPSTDDFVITNLKRQKLALKDEIEKLKSELN